MDIGTTCDSSLDFSKSSLESPTKSVNSFSVYNLDEIKKYYRKRKKILEKISKNANNVIATEAKASENSNKNSLSGGFNRIFNDYKTPVTKFVPSCRPDKKRFA